MQLSTPRVSRSPILPVLALAVLVYLNIVNRCADGYCYTYGWPWVAYYGWSDAGYDSQGNPLPDELAYIAALGNIGVAGIILLVAFRLQRAWHRRGG
jgi:hypothetical protein